MTIGNYRLIRLLGAGGMGAVYEVFHQGIGRRAAMKFLTLDVGRHPDLVTRFTNEAKAANQIQHPGVVQIYEFGQLDDGTPWMLMEFLAGETLSERMQIVHSNGGRFGYTGLILLHQLASILASTHIEGIVHRDLKPSNVMLVPDPAAALEERVKLLDFGIAKLRDESLRAEGGKNPHQTKTGMMLGTPAYMAPEQCISASKTDGQADVYALGIIAFQMFSGTLPYEDQSPLALMAQKLSAPAPPLPPLAPDLPLALPRLVGAMLQNRPADRPTMEMVKQELGTMLGLHGLRSTGFRSASDSSGTVVPAALRVETAAPLHHPDLPEVITKPAARHSAGKFNDRPLHYVIFLLAIGLTLFLYLLIKSNYRQTQLIEKAASPAVGQGGDSAEGGINAGLADLRPDDPPKSARTLAAAATAHPFEPAPERPAHPPSDKASTCIPATLTAGCVNSDSLTKAQSSQVVDALRESAVRLCVGEKIVISLQKTEAKIKRGSLPRETLDVLIPSLLGRFQGSVSSAQIEIRCPRPASR
jgi:serine/threonine protein kinase